MISYKEFMRRIRKTELLEIGLTLGLVVVALVVTVLYLRGA